MKIYHPQTALRGTERENSYVIVDDHGNEMGQGWLRVYSVREIMPDRPLRVCFEMEAHPDARDMLFGALMTRARLLCKQRGGQKARIYTICKPNQEEQIAYFQQNGMIVNDGNDLYSTSLKSLANAPTPPRGTQIEPVLLRNNAEYEALLHRVNRYSMDIHDDLWLSEASQMPFFTSLGVYMGPELVGEILLVGVQGQAELVMLYTKPEYQRQGSASSLIAAAKDVIKKRGSTGIQVVAQRSNRPMVRLLQRNAFEWRHILQVLPGIDT